MIEKRRKAEEEESQRWMERDSNRNTEKAVMSQTGRQGWEMKDTKEEGEKLGERMKGMKNEAGGEG